MARMGNFNSSEMKRFQRNLDKLQGANIDAFCEECAKELAARLLAKVIKRTPVGQYPAGSGKKGGTLRRGWTSQNGSGGNTSAKKAVESLRVQHIGDTYVIEIVNPVEYASYVEYGHRTRNHKGWVPGQFMMTKSEIKMGEIAPKVLENKLKKFLGSAFQ